MSRIFPLSIAAMLLMILCAAFLSKPLHGISLKGGCDQTNSPYIENIKNQNHRISFCKGGDTDVQTIVSDPFIAKDGLGFWYSGYPGRSGLEVSLADLSGNSIKLELPESRERWAFHKIAFPQHFLGSEVTLLATDNSTESFGWLGISSPVDTSHLLFKTLAIGLVKSLFIGVFVYLVLASLLAIFLKQHNFDNAISFFLVSLGFIGYIAFFIYFWDVNIGIGFSICCFLLLLALIIRLVLNKEIVFLIFSLKFLLPVVLLVFFVVNVGYFPFDKVGPDDWHTAANRWLSLPIDNWIPKIFADQIWEGKVRRPMIGDWLSSDRGPLQTGIVLIFYPLLPNDALLYQVVATILQALILLPVWLVLGRFSVKRGSEISFALGMSSLVVLHSLFVWPKLIAATYVLLVYLYLHTNRETILSTRSILIISASSALAMLSHGGAIFSLVVIGLFYFYDCFRSSQSQQGLKNVIVLILLFLLFMGPWLAYGKLIDPSSARLVKWHFAGHIPPSEIPFLDLLQMAYQRITFNEWLQGRVANFRVIFSGNFMLDILGGRDIKSNSFFAFNYSMWFFAFYFVIPVWFFARFPSLPVGVFRFLTISIMILVVWVLAMYEAGSTVIHQGSFFPWIGLFLVSCIVLQKSSALIFRLFLIGNLSILFFYYLPLTSAGSLVITLLYFAFLFFMIGWFFVSLRNLDSMGFDEYLCRTSRVSLS